MEIIAGMLLLCSVKINLGGSGFIFLKDVETRVHHITPKKDALIEYNYGKTKSILYVGAGNGPEYDMQAIDDMKRKDYMNCKKIGKNAKAKK